MTGLKNTFAAKAAAPRPQTLDEVKEFLRDRVGRKLDPVLEQRTIKLNLKHFDATFRAELDALTAQGLGPGVEPLAGPEAEWLRGALRGDFERVEMAAPTRIAAGPGAAERVSTAPVALLMHSPVQDYLGSNDLSSRLDIFRRWVAVKQALSDHGAQIAETPSHEADGAQMDEKAVTRRIFTRDKYFVSGNTAFLPDADSLRDLLPQKQPGYDRIEADVADYKADIAFFGAVLQDRGYDVQMVKGAWFEGGNLVPHPASGTVFMGQETSWDNKESAVLLQNAVNTARERDGLEPITIQNIPLVQEDPFYHLDLGLSEPLANGEVLFHDGVTDMRHAYLIEDIVGADKIVPVDEKDGRLFATNLVSVGKTLVMTGVTDDLKDTLKGLGYTAIGPQDYGVDKFKLGTGGVHCVTNADKPRDKRGFG